MDRYVPWGRFEAAREMFRGEAGEALWDRCLAAKTGEGFDLAAGVLDWCDFANLARRQVITVEEAQVGSVMTTTKHWRPL